MANAGRVAIVPKGDWSAAVEYKRLDAVAYNNTLYIAKKAVPAGTGTTNTEYWMKCVVGGAGSIATTEDAGTVKAGADIGVDSTGEMILKTDFTEQSDLTELTGTEDRQTFFGKIAKAVSTLISHISLGATADKAGHVKLSNSSAVTDSTGLALPATEKNAALDGTMANQIATLNKSLGQKTNGKFVLDNGLKMCWGIANNGSITFPITFTSVPFVIGSFSNGNNDVFFASHMTSRSVSGATYTGHYSTDGQIWVSYLNGLTWFAIGY